MIITVTMNPAVDKTVEVERLSPGQLNRLQNVRYDAGGKGINVSKTIHELGGESVAVGFLAGNTGRTIEKLLKDKGIRTDFVWVEGETRTNTKVLEADGSLTELNEPGPVIEKKQMEELLGKLEQYAREDSLVVLAGSVPKGVDKTIYGEITRRMHAKKVKVLLDADGELFQKAMEAGPDIIKPNRAELEEYAGLETGASDEALVEHAKRFRDSGTETIVVSMGAEGALLLLPDLVVQCPALLVQAHSTVGAGDAMVAALAYAWEQKLGSVETVRLCMAASAGAVATKGTNPPSRELVNVLTEQVIIMEIGEKVS